MACRAILLVEAALGKSAQVMHSLRGLECVKSAERVTPPYDVIAIVEVNASEEVTQEIQRQLGIADHHACDAVPNPQLALALLCYLFGAY